jgi:hypothetical protein
MLLKCGSHFSSTGRKVANYPPRRMQGTIICVTIAGKQMQIASSPEKIIATIFRAGLLASILSTSHFHLPGRCRTHYYPGL